MSGRSREKTNTRATKKIATQIAEKSGFSVTTVTQKIELLSLSQESRALVTDGRVTATLAWNTLKSTDGDAARTTALLADAVAKAQTKGKTRATRRDLGSDAPRASFKRSIRALVEIGDRQEDDDVVTVTWTRAEFARLLAALDA